MDRGIPTEAQEACARAIRRCASGGHAQGPVDMARHSSRSLAKCPIGDVKRVRDQRRGAGWCGERFQSAACVAGGRGLWKRLGELRRRIEPCDQLMLKHGAAARGRAMVRSRVDVPHTDAELAPTGATPRYRLRAGNRRQDVSPRGRYLLRSNMTRPRRVVAPLHAESRKSNLAIRILCAIRPIFHQLEQRIGRHRCVSAHRLLPCS